MKFCAMLFHAKEIIPWLPVMAISVFSVACNREQIEANGPGEGNRAGPRVV
jgi:hypothetical protein